jgi:molybdenum cofactor cytidylyltransferase
MVEVAALVMAAGRGSRFGGGPDELKVLALLDGRSLVCHVVDLALASRAVATLVVTGRGAEAVATALDEHPVTLVHNPFYARGMAGSLKAGLVALPPNIDGALVLLADMPRLRTATLDTLIAAFAASPDADAVVPIHDGREGNPALLARCLFPELMQLTGDTGARRLLAQAGRRIVRCQVDDPGILVDVDTREALQALGG